MFKKLKKARHDNPTGDGAKDLEQQLEALKHLDCKQIATTALTTKIKKDKKLSEHPLVRSAVSAELTLITVSSVPSGTPKAKAQNRLLSSKLLAAGVATVLEALRNYLNSASDMGEMPDQKGMPGSAWRRKDKDRTSSPVSASDSDEGHRRQDSEERVATEGEGWQSGTVSDEPSAVEGWESGSVRDSDDYDKVSDDVSDFGDQATPPSSAKVQTRKSVSLSKSESVFLPTLSVGFARGGGSDSEFSDSEANVADGVRKNRRGQRARRAIWEKKYGKNARHLKKRREITKQVGSAAARGQKTLRQSAMTRRDYDARVPKQTGVVKPMSDRPMGRGASTGTDPPRTRKEQRDERPLHPSWEAKKKQKKIGIVPSQGTKIVFDP
ncbi:Bud-site selection protein [Pisolithus albus]|nr:Bud-site selection protein [Pisolithus albus]